MIPHDNPSCDETFGEMGKQPTKRPRGGPPVAEEFLGQLAQRINERLGQLDLTPAQVVKITGIGTSTIYNILRGEQSNPQLSVLMAISNALDVPLAWLVGATDTFKSERRESAATVPVVGTADAGAYRVAMTSGPQQHVRDIPPTNERLIAAKRYAIEVRDNHLEGLTPPVTPGHMAYYVDFQDIDADIESDRIYLLYRKNETGQVQTAFWQATVYRDRVRFAPVSRSEDYNSRMAFTVLRRDLHASEAVTIGGLFYAATYEYA